MLQYRVSECSGVGSVALLLGKGILGTVVVGQGSVSRIGKVSEVESNAVRLMPRKYQ